MWDRVGWGGETRPHRPSVHHHGLGNIILSKKITGTGCLTLALRGCSWEDGGGCLDAALIRIDNQTRGHPDTHFRLEHSSSLNVSDKIKYHNHAQIQNDETPIQKPAETYR